LAGYCFYFCAKEMRQVYAWLATETLRSKPGSAISVIVHFLIARVEASEHSLALGSWKPGRVAEGIYILVFVSGAEMTFRFILLEY